MSHDTTQNFLNSLPELKEGERFQFRCHPGVNCFNACCSDLNLMLTPYDVLRLRQSLNLSSKDFIEQHAAVSQYPDTGFPSLHLNMSPKEGLPCPYVSPQGCTVYPNRPGACRTYPIGRATKLDDDNQVVEQFFVVKEAHCNGFEEDGDWDATSWASDQGIQQYNTENDKYMRIMARQKATGTPISPKFATMCLLALYQPDSFQDFIKNSNLFSRLDMDPERQAAILEDEEAALNFGLNWIELMLFGASDSVKLKKG